MAKSGVRGVHEPEFIRLNPKQSLFYHSTARHIAFFGGIGSGKTITACIRGIDHCLRYPATVGVVVRNTHVQLNDSTKKVFMDYLHLIDSGRPSTKKIIVGENNNENWVRLSNGSMVFFRHAGDEGLFKGPEYDWFIVDQAEEVKEEIAKRLTERLRGKHGPNTGMWVGNTDRGHNWCYRWFKLGEKPDSELIETVFLDNADNLPDGYVREQLKRPEEEKAIYLYGSWDNPGGLVLRLSNIHFVRDFPIPDGWHKYVSIDPAGARGTTAALGGVVDYDGNVFIMKEYYHKDRLVKTHAEGIKSIWGNKTYLMYMDPSAWRKEQGDDIQFTTLADRYRRFGVFAVPAENAISVGIDILRGLAVVDEDHRHPLTGEKGAPHIYFSRTGLPNTMEEIASWMLEDPSEEPCHAVDALRYMVSSGYVVPTAGSVYAGMRESDEAVDFMGA